MSYPVLVDILHVVYFEGSQYTLVEVRKMESEAVVADTRWFPLDSLTIGLA